MLPSDKTDDKNRKQINWSLFATPVAKKTQFASMSKNTKTFQNVN